MNHNQNNWIIRTNDFRNNAAKVEVTENDKSERTTYGGGQLLKFWGVALLCLFIPVLHFVLVPTFLVVGIVAFFKSNKKKLRIVNDGTAKCPNCQKDIKIKSAWFESQIRFNCQNCSEQLVFELKSD